jgi:hypothetical protein
MTFTSHRTVVLSALFGIVAAGALPVHAQTVSNVKVDKAQVAINQPVTVTVNFDVRNDLINCGMRVSFGDGSQQDFKINQTKDVPLVVQHRYATAGDFKVTAEPKTVSPILKCNGKNQTAMVNVLKPAPVAPPPVAVAAPAAVVKAPAKPASPCPDGWTLDKAGVNKKTGAFVCRAKPGTPAPAQTLSCSGSLGYFVNSSKGRLGCQP